VARRSHKAKSRQRTGPRVLFKPETASSQTRSAAGAQFQTSRPGPATITACMYMILASAVIRRPKSAECHHPKCARPKRILKREKETGGLRARDVAKLFQVTPQHVYKIAAGGRLPSFRLAGAIRFDPHELANWLRKAQPVAFRPEEGNQFRRSAYFADGGATATSSLGRSGSAESPPGLFSVEKFCGCLAQGTRGHHVDGYNARLNSQDGFGRLRCRNWYEMALFNDDDKGVDKGQSHPRHIHHRAGASRVNNFTPGFVLGREF
jgi:Helix-turn-helix domain